MSLVLNVNLKNRGHLSLSFGGWRDGLKMLTRGDGGMEGNPAEPPHGYVDLPNFVCFNPNPK